VEYPLPALQKDRYRNREGNAIDSRVHSRDGRKRAYLYPGFSTGHIALRRVKKLRD
jgi:hypothetical protein